MKLSSGSVKLLGFFTVLQLLVWIVAGIYAVLSFIPIVLSGDEESIKTFVLSSMAAFLVLLVVMSLIGLTLLVIYIAHASYHQRLSSAFKVLWIVLFLLFGAVAELVYFFMEVRPHHSLQASGE